MFLVVALRLKRRKVVVGGYIDMMAIQVDCEDIASCW